MFSVSKLGGFTVGCCQDLIIPRYVQDQEPAVCRTYRTEKDPKSLVWMLTVDLLGIKGKPYQFTLMPTDHLFTLKLQFKQINCSYISNNNVS